MGVGGIFCFLYVPNEFLMTLPKAPQFLSHHVIQSSRCIYITCRREGDMRKHASMFGSAACSKNIGNDQSNNF